GRPADPPNVHGQEEQGPGTAPADKEDPRGAGIGQDASAADQPAGHVPADQRSSPATGPSRHTGAGAVSGRVEGLSLATGTGAQLEATSDAPTGTRGDDVTTALLPILGGVVLPGPHAQVDVLAAEASRTFEGYFKIIAHFDPES